MGIPFFYVYEVIKKIFRKPRILSWAVLVFAVFQRVAGSRILPACVVFLLIAFAPRPGLAFYFSGSYTSITIDGVDCTSGDTTIISTLTIWAGSLTELAGYTLTVNGTTLINGGGTLTNNGTLYSNVGTLTNTGTLNNSGLLDNDSTSTLTNNFMLTNNAGGTLTNSGTLANNGGRP